jgi:hypothetical protein
MPAKSKAQQKFMGMVHAAQKGEKPASPEVAKVAKGMSKKAAKDYASTKHKGLPEKKKQKIKETLEKIDQLKELISEAKKKMKGEDPCWKGYEMVGTKKKGGKEVPNCVPKNEDIEESGLQYYTGKKKYGKDGMTALAKAGRKGASEEELGRIKDKYKKVKENSASAFADLEAEIQGKGSSMSDLEKKASDMRSKMPAAKPTKVKDMAPVDRYELERSMGRFKGSYADWLKTQEVKEGKKSKPVKKDLTGDGKNDFDDVQAARRMASGQSKKAAVKSATSDKLKESNKDDLPFDPDPDTDGPKKDKYGNIIKTKNMAKHLAKKGRAAAEQEAKKKKETVKEGWDHDSLASRLFETFDEVHDHEASMAKAQLMRIAEQSIELFKMIQEGDNLEGWVAAKITKANDYINSVHQNLAYDEVSNDVMEENFSNDVDNDLRMLANEDEEELIAALQGDYGSGIADALNYMMDELQDELASKGMNDVMNDQDKMIEMLWDKLVDKYGNESMEQPMEVVDDLYDEDDYISELRKNLEKELNS